MMTWLFTREIEPKKVVYVQADRWYEARQFAETYLRSGSHDGISWRIPENGAWDHTTPLFKITWSGHAAGRHDNIKMTVTEIKDRR